MSSRPSRAAPLRVIELEDLPYRVVCSQANIPGKGGFGQVWRGEHKVNRDERVAVKEVAKNRCDGKYLDREIEFSQKLSTSPHRNVVGFLGHEIQENAIYFILELCDGNLNKLFKEDEQEFEKCVRYAEEMAAGLGHLHGLNICHRDLKPLNILVREECMKIADLGLARQLLETSNTPVGATARVGTTGWRAPEIPLMGQGVYNLPVDVFSLALIFRSMLFQTVGKDLIPQIEGDSWLADWLRAMYNVKRALASIGIEAPVMVPDLHVRRDDEWSNEWVNKFLELTTEMLCVKPEERIDIATVCERIAAIKDGMARVPEGNRQWRRPIKRVKPNKVQLPQPKPQSAQSNPLPKANSIVLLLRPSKAKVDATRRGTQYQQLLSMFKDPLVWIQLNEVLYQFGLPTPHSYSHPPHTEQPGYIEIVWEKLSPHHTQELQTVHRRGQLKTVLEKVLLTEDFKGVSLEVKVPEDLEELDDFFTMQTEGGPSEASRKRAAEGEGSTSSSKLLHMEPVTIKDLREGSKNYGVLHVKVLYHVFSRARSTDVRYIHVHVGDHTSVEPNGCLLLKAFESKAEKLKKILKGPGPWYLELKGSLAIKHEKPENKFLCPEGCLNLMTKEVNFRKVDRPAQCPDPQVKNLSEIQDLAPCSRIRLEKALVGKARPRKNPGGESLVDLALYDASERRCVKLSVRTSSEYMQGPDCISVREAWVHQFGEQKCLGCKEDYIQSIDDQDLMQQWKTENINPEDVFQPPFRYAKNITQVVKGSKELKQYWPMYFEVQASIKTVLWKKGANQVEQKFMYLGCPNDSCRLKVQQGDKDSIYECRNCPGDVENPQWRYCLKLQLGDAEVEEEDEVIRQLENLDLDYNAVREEEEDSRPEIDDYDQAQTSEEDCDEYEELKATAFDGVAEMFVRDKSCAEAANLWRTKEGQERLDLIFKKQLDSEMKFGIKATKADNPIYGPANYVIVKVFPDR